MIVRQRALLVLHSVDIETLRLLFADGFEVRVRRRRCEGSFDDDDRHVSLLGVEERRQLLACQRWNGRWNRPVEA